MTTANVLATLTTQPTSTQASATLVAGGPNPIDTTGGNATWALPTPTAVGQLLSAEKIDSTTNTLTISGTIRGAAGTVTLVGKNESIVFTSESMTSWRPVSGHKPLAMLDARYDPAGTASADVATETTRAQAAEQANATNIATNTTATQTNAAAIAAETTRAKAAEAANATAITANQTAIASKVSTGTAAGPPTTTGDQVGTTYVDGTGTIWKVSTTGSGSTPDTWAQSGAYAATVAASGDTTGATDVTKLQALLTAARAAGSGIVKGAPGSTYYWNTPPVIGSGTTLDLTGCTINLAANANTNMLQNWSVANPTATGTGSMTAGSTTGTNNVVTTSVAASVGQTVLIAGAGGNGNGPLIGNVSAVGSGTLTLTTLDGRPAYCTATVSGAALTVFNRDHDIKIVGGTWNRGANGGATGIQNHSLLLRHIDGLDVDIENYLATGGKYGVAIGDCTMFNVRIRDSSCSSSSFQGDGPLYLGDVDIRGTTHDDLCPLTAGNWPNVEIDVGGDIISVTARGSGTSTAANGCKIIAGAGRYVDNIRMTFRGTASENGVWIGDDTSYPGTTGGTYGYVEADAIGTVNVAGGSYALVKLYSPNAEHIKVRARYGTDGTITGGIPIATTGSSTATIGLLEVVGEITNTNLVYLLTHTATALTINELVISKLYGVMPSGAYLIWQTASTITRITFDHCYLSGGAALYRNSSGGNSPVIVVTGGKYTGFSRIANNYQSGQMVVLLNNPEFDSLTNAAFYVSGGSLMLAGMINPLNTAALAQRAASETVTCYGESLPVDLAILARVVGERALDASNRCAKGILPATCTTTATSGWVTVAGGTY